MMNTNKDKTKVSAPDNAQLWRELRQMIAQRDELLAALTKAQPIVFQWEHRVYHGKTELADEITNLITKCKASK